MNRDHTRRPYADKLLGHRFVVDGEGFRLELARV